MRTPAVSCQTGRLPELRTRWRPGAHSRVIEALKVIAARQPGVAASVTDVVEQLALTGVTPDPGTVADWLQQEALDDSSPATRVAHGHYALADHHPEVPVVALGPTHRRVLHAARELRRSGRESWTLLELVEVLAATGPAVGRRRLHDVVTELRDMDPPLVLGVGRGRFRLCT